MTATDANRICAAMPKLDEFRLTSALRYLRRAVTPFDVFFFVESVAAGKEPDKRARVISLYRDHAAPGDKIELAGCWAFTAPFRFGSALAPIVRHVMHDDCFADTAWVRDRAVTSEPLGCFTGPNTHCPCVRWLSERPDRVNAAVEIVIGHLCAMRHSLVHESWPVLMVAEYDPNAASPTYSSVALDVYPCDRDDPELYRSYETGISFDRFRAISIAAARNHLLAAYPGVR